MSASDTLPTTPIVRRVRSCGGSTILALPTAWARKHHLDQDPYLSITIAPDGSLILRPLELPKPRNPKPQPPPNGHLHRP